MQAVSLPCPLPVRRAPRIDPLPASGRYIRLIEPMVYFAPMRPPVCRPHFLSAVPHNPPQSWLN